MTPEQIASVVSSARIRLSREIDWDGRLSNVELRECPYCFSWWRRLDKHLNGGCKRLPR